MTEHLLPSHLTGPLPLTAYVDAGSEPRARLTPAARARAWMPETPGRSAKWCLPLLMANEAGWVVGSPGGVTITWDGSPGQDGLDVRWDDPTLARAAVSTFGFGIVTWEIPYLFRTPPEFDLLARGPANLPKDGVSPLEGLVETDWAVHRFTMNWKITRPDLPIRWEKDEPVCMIVPQRRSDLAAFRPQIRPLTDAPELHELAVRAARERRLRKVGKVVRAMGYGTAEDMSDTKRQYFRGVLPDGTSAPAHRAQVRLRPFVETPGAGDESSVGVASPQPRSNRQIT